MPFTQGRSSTQDASGGTPVSLAANEDAGAGQLQAVADVGNKSTFVENSRAGVNVADAGTDLTAAALIGAAGANLGYAGNAKSIEVRGTCDTVSKTLVLRVVFYDGANNPLSYSDKVTLSSDATRRAGAAGPYVCQRQLIDAGQAVKFFLYVETVSGGTWNVYGRGV